MATITNSNLYPPTIDTYMPAFLVDGDNELKRICRIYFSISSYNSFSDIKNAQVVVSNQDTNTSVLNKDKYPCEIKLTPIYEDITRTSEDRYYIEIESSDLIPEHFNQETQQYESRFEINQYYKVQIRFTSKEAADISMATPQAIDSWLANNLGKFSEWSTVCLIRGISAPTLTLKNLDSTADSSIWSSSNVDLVGRLSFSNPAETETLKSYRVKLYDDNDNLIIDSGDLYSNNYVDVNEINYTFKYFFQDGESYFIELTYITKSLYTETITYKIAVVEGTIDKLEAELSAIQDPDNGRIGIRIKGTSSDLFIGNITIRRTSSESNFTIWEDVFTTSIESTYLDVTWYDYTIKSGVWYKYCAQKRNGWGSRGIIVNLQSPQMIVFDDIFLTAEEKQLKIRFDPSIGSYKRTVLEAKTDTIGSKYPFVKRNGYANYREFTMNGLITCFMDYDCDNFLYVDSLGHHYQEKNKDNYNFVSKEDLYKDSLNLYTEYNNQNRITDFNDFTFERDFREKVLDFLYKDNVKLFRSATEGNILVKLMNINLTPNQTLGRRVYSFSCTAYEIADFTLENCDLYNISPLGTYSNSLELESNYIGQINQVIPANVDVFEILRDKYKNYAPEGYQINIDYLDYLKLEIASEPHLILEDNAPTTMLLSEENVTPISYVGHEAYINGKYIIIPSDGVYELKDSNIKITSLKFPVDTEVLINYNIIFKQMEDLNSMIKNANYYKKIGQLLSSFEPEISVYQQIWKKYFEKNSIYTTSMIALNAIKVEANAGTILYIKELGEDSFEKHIIGETELLEIYNENSIIEDFYFKGIHFEKATLTDAERNVLPYNKYLEDQNVYKNLNEIVDPLINYVYTLEDGQKYIWYNMEWFLFSENQDIDCSINAMVDYFCETMKGMYA